MTTVIYHPVTCSHCGEQYDCNRQSKHLSTFAE